MEQKRKFNRFPSRALKNFIYSFIAFFFTLFVLIQTWSFQTYLGRKLSKYLSKELKTEVRIGRVGIDFFQHAEFKDVFVKDLHGDTLLLAKKISCNLSKFIYPFNRLQLDKIELEQLNSKIIRYKGEEDFNFQFIADYFKSSEPSSRKASNFELLYGDIVLKSVHFSFIEKNDTVTHRSGINYNDLSVHDLKGNIRNFRMEKDTLFAEISELSVTEKSGFELQSFSGEVKVCPSQIKVNNLVLNTKDSYLNGNFEMNTQSYDDYSDFLNKVSLKLDLNEGAFFNPSDISYFVSDLTGLDQEILFSGNIKGTINSLRGKNLHVKYRDHTVFSGDLSVDGLPNLSETYLHVEIDTLQSCRKDLVNIPVPPFNEKKKLELPDVIEKFGVFRFKGTIDGMLNDIIAFGDLKTDLGKVKMDLGLNRTSSNQDLVRYKGRIVTNQFMAGVLSGNTDLGPVSMDVTVVGTGLDLEKLEANLEGKISSLVYKNYEYNDITLEGLFQKKLFNGSFISNDENAKLDFKGSASFQDKIPELDFQANIERIDFSKLNFFKQDSASEFSSKLSIKIHGDSPDNVSGRISFQNSIYKYVGKTYSIKEFDLILEQDKLPKYINLNSGLADLTMSGDFNLTNLPRSVGRFLNHYYPTFFDFQASELAVKKQDRVDFKIKIKKFDLVNGLFLPSLNFSENTIFEGVFDSKQNFISCFGKIDRLSFNEVLVEDWKIKIESQQGIKLKNEFEKISIADSFYIQNFKSNISSFDTRSEFSMNWLNQTVLKNSGDLSGLINFTTTTANVSLDNFQIYIQDSLWSLKNQNRIAVDSIGRVEFRDVSFQNNAQLLSINGTYSSDANDKVFVEMKDFKLSQINPLLRDANLSLAGYVSGINTLMNNKGNFIFVSEMDFKNLYVNDKLVGSGRINASYDKLEEVISMNGALKKDFSVAVQNDFHNLKFKGYYYPARKEENIDLDVNLESIEIGILQPYVKDILTFGRGYLSGKVEIHGMVNEPKLSGYVNMESIKNFKVDYLNTLYRISGGIKIEPDRLAFEDIKLYDLTGNQGTIWGNVFHDNFKNLKYDFDIQLKKMACLNTNVALNKSFYGKAFATGNVGIWGNTDVTNIEVNLKTEKGTQFNIPLSGPAEVGENEFIHFVNKDTLNSDQEEKVDLSGMNLLFNLEATPEAEIQLIFDEKAGDVIKAKGNGNIKMAIDSRGKFEMYGPYTITDGSYLFTLENFINKKFDIENGSTIKWSGDPYNAIINISANYRQRASLAPFFPVVQASAPTDATATGSSGTVSGSTSTSAITSGQDVNKRYPVECKLYMKEKLLSPEITFGIALPTVDDAIRQTVLGYINNEQELNRQVFSLLILKSFVTPLVLSNSSGVSAGNAVGSNATEMLSNQLSNWLSQLTTNIDVGVNYRPGDALSNEELDLALSTQLFNDKLSIDGNVGLNNSAQTKSSNMIGDLNMDYKITEDGKLRVKGFNRSNDTYLATTQGGQFTQGVGFFYREDFETLYELYRRYTKFISRKKKTAVPSK